MLLYGNVLSKIVKNINQNRIEANRSTIHEMKKIKSIREERDANLFSFFFNNISNVSQNGY